MKKTLLTLIAALSFAGAAAQTAAERAAGTYTGELYVSLGVPVSNETPCTTGERVQLTAASEAVDLALYNFKFNGAPMGDIVLPAIGLTKNGTHADFAENDAIDLSLAGGAIQATASVDPAASYVKGDSLIAAINVVWINGDTQLPIYVLFKGQKPGLYNGSFNQDWVRNYPWDSKNGFIVNDKMKDYVTPEGWCVANVAGMGGSGATQIAAKEVVDEATGDFAVTLTNTPNPLMTTQIVPGYISLGTTWATASVINLAKSADGGAFGGKPFTLQPDALTFKYKRAHGEANAEEPASVVAYLWKGSTTQVKVPGETAFVTPTSCTMVDRDRNILGKETATGGEVTKSEDFALVASLEQTINGDAAEWETFKADFNYPAGVEVAPEKINVIISANDYFGDRELTGAENSLTVDDVQLLFYHQLSAVSLAGMPVPAFAPEVTTYEFPGVTFDLDTMLDKIEYTTIGRGATVEVIPSTEDATITLRVKAQNIEADPAAFTDYVFQFAAVTGIDAVHTAPAAAAPAYTLSGARVNGKGNLPAGVYVIGGKKVIK